MSALQNYAEANHYDLLSKFESIKEFNSHFEQAMLLHKEKFTKSEYIALNKLRKFAANFFGVAWCKIQKAVAGTHKDEMFGVSRSTFERMLRKAKKINLLTVINQERANKWQKHNVYVFNRMEDLRPEVDEIVSVSRTIEVPEVEKIDVPITINPSELAIKNNNKTYQQAETASMQNNNLVALEKPLDQLTNYDQMKKLVFSFTGDKKLASKFYGIWLSQISKLISKPDFELAMNATRTTLFAMKTKDIKNPRGYFNNTIGGMIDTWIEGELRSYQELFEESAAGTGPDWLNW